MSDIPKARAIMEEALKSDNIEIIKILIRGALAEMTREFNGRTEARSDKMTDNMKMAARNMRDQGRSMQDIAVRLNVNIGRISEALSK